MKNQKLNDYVECRDWLESFIPLVWGKSELGLRRIEFLLKLLGNPEKKFKSIHVAGTSSKGSTAFYIARLLEIAGPVTSSIRGPVADFPSIGATPHAIRQLKVGLHVSPHLVDIRERMTINDEMIPMRNFINLVNEIKSVVDKIQKQKPDLTPSYFEILVALSFLYFAEEKVDWAVVEVGLGGRLDATNVLTPKVSVITNIGLDHTEILGDTVEKIAREKAGIIKTNVPVVTGASGKALKVIEKVAKEKKASLIKLGTQEVKIDTETDIQVDNKEYYDIDRYIKNDFAYFSKKLALLAILSIKDQRMRMISQKSVGGAFSAKFPGRFEEIDKDVILDGAHNPDKITYLVKFMRSIIQGPTSRKAQGRSLKLKSQIILVIAFKKGKDWKKMIDLLLKNLPVEKVIATEYQTVTDTGFGSAVPAEEIKKYIDNRYKMIDVSSVKNSHEAVFSAIRRLPLGISKKTNGEWLRANGAVLVTGSLYLVGEARTLWKLPQF